MNIIKLFLIIIEIVFFMKLCHGSKNFMWDDYYTSVEALADIFKTEKLLIENFERFIIASKVKLSNIKSFMENWKTLHFSKFEENSTLKNYPMSSFKEMYRLTVYLPNLLEYIIRKSAIDYTEVMINISREYDYPSNTDLEGATLGLLRVQEAYGVPTEDLANGIIKGIEFRTKFKASDCFEVALKLREMNYPYFSIEWYKMGFKRLEEEGFQGITPKSNEVDLLDSMAYAQYLDGSFDNSKAAIETSLKALNKTIDDDRLLHLVYNLPGYIKNFIDIKNGFKKPTSLEFPIGALRRDNMTELQLLIKGCRGELNKSPAELSKLYCTYENRNHPFLLLAPIKVEVLNLSPRVVSFHDVIYDSEIEILKQLSYHKLTRAVVWNQAKAVSEESFIRSSKFSWLDNATHPLMHTINRRLQHMTGLTMETAEQFLIMNYGIGGHYDIHPDFFYEPRVGAETKPYGNFENGNRIATVLFYLSDVAHGGATVWPLFNTVMWPRKGSAVFWYNLHADGDIDTRTRHAACPIILGSKWVLNKWFRIRGQEFRRPCLKYADSRMRM